MWSDGWKVNVPGSRPSNRQVLKSSVLFEKRIRDRWREKCLAKNRRIAELEERIVKLERSLGEKEEL